MMTKTKLHKEQSGNKTGRRITYDHEWVGTNWDTMASVGDDADMRFEYERWQHLQVMQLASSMFKTGMDRIWECGSLMDHAMAAGSGGMLLTKAADICGRMADGQYDDDDQRMLSLVITSLDRWVNECTADVYEVSASLRGKPVGLRTVKAPSIKSALKHAKELFNLDGTRHDSLNAVVETDE